MKICTKNDFYNFVQSDLDLGPVDLKFALFVTHVSTKLEFSMAFLFRENQRHGMDEQIDGCNA